MGWLVKIGFSCNALAIRLAQGYMSTESQRAIRPITRLYVHHITTGRMSALTSFGENLIFSPLSAYSPTPKANKGPLRPPNTDRNLHAKK
jgi:hypothetical protein